MTEERYHQVLTDLEKVKEDRKKMFRAIGKIWLIGGPLVLACFAYIFYVAWHQYHP